MAAEASAAAPGEARPTGKTTIAPEVLLTIARLSALGVPGVAGTSLPPAGVSRLFKRGVIEGVQVDVDDQMVTVEVYLVVEHDHSVREVGRAVQAAVARAIQEMTGMGVRAVNVHVEDVAYPGAGTQPEE